MFSDAHRVVTKTYLAIHLSRIVFLPENIQQLFVRDFRRIVFQLHSFRVPCGTTAHFVVCWIHCLAPSVTDCRLSNTGNSLERQFHAPETPGCKCSLLLLLRHLHSQFSKTKKGSLKSPSSSLHKKPNFLPLFSHTPRQRQKRTEN
jgi:hypothetical protein